jgi:alpha-mannosidase
LDFRYTRTASNRISSGDWEAVIDRESGCITSFFDKKTRTEFLGGRGIVPVVVDDESDTWTHALSSYQGARHPMAMESYTLVCRGAISTEYEIVYKLFSSTVIVCVNLNGAEGRLDLKVRVIWNEHHRLLKLCIGSAFSAPTFISEISYGTIERAADETGWPLQRWAKLSSGGMALAVLNDGIYSGSARAGSLDLTLLRSPVYANHENHHPRDKSVHGGDLPAERSFCAVRSGTALISVVKHAEDDDGWVVRAVEAAGRKTQAEFDFAWLGVRTSLPFGPYEIKTIKIADRDRVITETSLLEF